jgi:hypothetical protein
MARHAAGRPQNTRRWAESNRADWERQFEASLLAIAAFGRGEVDTKVAAQTWIVPVGGDELGQESSPEQARENLHGQNEVRSARHPTRAHHRLGKNEEDQSMLEAGEVGHGPRAFLGSRSASADDRMHSSTLGFSAANQTLIPSSVIRRSSVDPAAIAAQINACRRCTAAALASTVRPAGPGAPHPRPVAADERLGAQLCTIPA